MHHFINCNWFTHFFYLDKTVCAVFFYIVSTIIINLESFLPTGRFQGSVFFFQVPTKSMLHDLNY